MAGTILETQASDAPRRGASVQDRVARVVSRPLFWAVFVAIAVSWPIARSLWAWGRMPEPLPVLATVPDFTLTDQFGRPFPKDALRGHVWVAGFMFTRCPTVCPRLTETMREVQRRGKHLGQVFHLVSFSVDPTHDTPEVLRAYADSWQVRHSTWSFLTGDSEEMRATVVDGLKIAMGDAAGQDPSNVLHGTHFVLVDGLGRIRGYYDSADPLEIDRMLRDAGLLANRGD